MILPAWKTAWPTTSPVDLVPCRVRALLGSSVSRSASGSRLHEQTRDPFHDLSGDIGGRMGMKIAKYGHVRDATRE